MSCFVCFLVLNVDGGGGGVKFFTLLLIIYIYVFNEILNDFLKSSYITEMN